MWAEPTAYTYYDPHSLPSDGVATPPWTFNPLVITPRGEADADTDGGDGAAAVGDGAGTSIHAGGGAALALPNPNSPAPMARHALCWRAPTSCHRRSSPATLGTSTLGTSRLGP